MGDMVGAVVGVGRRELKVEGEVDDDSRAAFR